MSNFSFLVAIAKTNTKCVIDVIIFFFYITATVYNESIFVQQFKEIIP